MKRKWFFGIDVSKETLDVTLYVKEHGPKSPHRQFENNESGYRAIIKWLIDLNVDPEFSLFCLEHTGIYSIGVSLFFEQEKMSYSLVSALHIKRSLGLVRGKNDKIDSYQISRFCNLHREELPLTKLPMEPIRILKGLVNERERLVKMQRTEKIVLGELKSISTDNAAIRIENRINIFAADINAIEQEIQQIIKADPSMSRNFELTKSIIGIGLVNAVLFIIYTCNYTVFIDARKYACYGGIAPFENASGTSLRGKTKVSHLANKRIKVNLTNAARSAIQNDPELKIYYNRKAKEGKEHGVIMNAIKFKLIMRVFAVVKRGTPFVKMRQAG